jgi:hypothetical protein
MLAREALRSPPRSKAEQTMPHIFISGHGGWKPEYGFTQVPRGVKVHFYTHFAKNLMTDMEYRILDGSFTDKDRTIEEYAQCPNMRASGQPDSWTETSENKLNKAVWGNDSMVVGVPEGDAANLAELFKELDVLMNGVDETLEIHWLACSTVQLKQVGGRSHGLNAADFRHHGDKPGRYRIRSGDTFNWK